MAETQGKYTYAVGRRKTSIAQVRLYAGKGNSLVNGKPVEEAFPLPTQKASLFKPFVVLEALDKYYFDAKVQGGGTTGQLEAIRHGIARALVKLNEDLKPVLKAKGLVTRDSRMKERKKVYTRGARRGKQFSKR